MGGIKPFKSLQILAHLLILRPILKVFFGAGTEGRENLEGLEQFIMVANHNSHLDTPFLFKSSPSASFPGPTQWGPSTTSERQRSSFGWPSFSSVPFGS